MSFDRVERAKEIRDRVSLSMAITRNMVRVDELSAEELEGLKILYPEWQVDKEYKKDTVVKYQNDLYKVVQNHKSQADWTPDKVASLFTKVAPEGVIDEWKQPLGGHDAYNKGDKVLFDGIVYESLNNANVHSPSAYPAGWQKVE